MAGWLAGRQADVFVYTEQGREQISIHGVCICCVTVLVLSAGPAKPSLDMCELEVSFVSYHSFHIKRKWSVRPGREEISGCDFPCI